MDDKQLLKKDLVLTYRVNRFGGKEAQIDLDGLWLPADVRKMERAVLKAVKGHKAEILRDIKKEKKDGKRKPKSK